MEIDLAFLKSIYRNMDILYLLYFFFCQK